MALQIVVTIFFVLHTINSQSRSCYYHPKSLPVPLYAHLAIYSNFSNSVYIFGGNTPNASDLIYKWDLNPNSWFEPIGHTSSPFFSYGNNAVIINDIVYFIGMEDHDVASGIIYMFDIKTESWLSNMELKKPTMPLSHGCLTTNNTHIFMLDGININVDEAVTPVLQIYEIATNSWTGWSVSGLGSYPGGWRYQYCSMINNELYIFGGRVATDSPAYSNKIYKFDAITETMTLIDDTLPIPQSWGVAVNHGHLIYTVGSFPYTWNINVFDINTETITNTIFEMTQPLSAPASLILDDKLYIFGGEDDTLSALATVQICDLTTNNLGNPTAIPTVIPTQSQVLIIPNKPTATPSKTSSTLFQILTSDSGMNKLFSKDTSTDSDSSLLILGIIGVSTLCLILMFCVLIYFRLRKKPSNNQDNGKRKTHVKVQSASSFSPIVSNPNDMALEKINPGNDFNEPADMSYSNHKYAVIPGEMIAASISFNENEGFEGMIKGKQEPLLEITNELSNSEHDSDNYNELYKKGNKKTKGIDDMNESDNELYAKGNKTTKGSNESNGNNDDLLNESDDNQQLLSSNL